MAAPRMTPAPSSHLLRYVGDRLEIELALPGGEPSGLRAFLRTNLTRARVARAEVVAQAGVRREELLTFAGASWRDIPLTETKGGWSIDLPLLEVGHFRAKAYYVDARGHQHWPEGDDLGISVHPDHLRSANTVYCAFPRTFLRRDGRPFAPEAAVRELDALGYTVIPPSGTLRDLTRVLPHVFDELGCRVLHLLPIGPVPTTYARMGRYGSPYAQLDLALIDPALAEFDKRTTAVEQFRELCDGVHVRSGLVLLDIVLNHTGWASRLLDLHPDWFKRNPDGTFHSPGAWGVTWEDLVELDQRHPELWDVLADALLTWCRRGVDGFRCDAGYMVPVPAWQYIVARVRACFPDCVFLLEGLGGPWESTATLLTHGGMQWAYSELFQCFEPAHVASYLDHAFRESERIGVLVHYSETHDNDRLARKGARFSSMRNHLCALSSQSGAFGFSAGVEWLCTDKFLVHDARPLGFGNPENLVAELGRLNRLLDRHPCFFDGATIERVSPSDSFVLALERTSRDGRDVCLVLVNLDAEHGRELALPIERWLRTGEHKIDLLSGTPPTFRRVDPGLVSVSLSPGESLCLAEDETPRGLSGDDYRTRRAQAAFAYVQLGSVLPHECLGPADFEALAARVAVDPAGFLGCIAALDRDEARKGLLEALARASERTVYAKVVMLQASDARRVTLVPPDHWVLIHDPRPFAVDVSDGEELHLRSVPVEIGHVAAIPPRHGEVERDVRLVLDRFDDAGTTVEATLRRLAAVPRVEESPRETFVLQTNDRGSMSRIAADLGAVYTRFDGLLVASLDAERPSERRMLVKRARVWVNADGFITQLDADNLARIESGPPSVWSFAANAGDGRRVGVRLTLTMPSEEQRVSLRFERVSTGSLDLPADREVRLTIRVDLEDRAAHDPPRMEPTYDIDEVARSVRALDQRPGFARALAGGGVLVAATDSGSYHSEMEWSRGVAHRGDEAGGPAELGYAFSPGWFDVPLDAGVGFTLEVGIEGARARPRSEAVRPDGGPDFDDFTRALCRAMRAFVVRTSGAYGVLAGFPWLPERTRDEVIVARGLIAAGMLDEAQSVILRAAAREREGVLAEGVEPQAPPAAPDASLWLALAVEELARVLGAEVYELAIDSRRTLGSVLESIADHYLSGTVTGVRVDPDSGLVWLAERAGYPIDVNALFVRMLEQLARQGLGPAKPSPFEWAERARQAFALFAPPGHAFLSDRLLSVDGVSARAATVEEYLRPRSLLAITLGMVAGPVARSTVEAARSLLVPGALRPLAQHDGPASVASLACYAEALSIAYDGHPSARAAARAALGSTATLLGKGCLGQLPENVAGDAPHEPRGSDAFALSASETLRVWLKLRDP